MEQKSQSSQKSEIVSPTLQRLSQEHAVTQLRSQCGQMAQLGRDEQGTRKLGWVGVVPALLKQPELLGDVEQEASAIWQRGIRHVIWAGMGGSIRPVEMLVMMGYCQESEGITIYPLQSTDPEALNAVVRAIARAKQIPLSPDRPLDGAEKRQLFEDVLLIAVSLSKTSEEPLSHVMWFFNLLRHAHLAPESHVLVLPLAQSLLEQLAHEHHLPMLNPFLTKHRFAGRMSAPGSRVFLLPVALSFAHAQGKERGYLAAILRQAWDWFDVALAEQRPGEHAFVQLACALERASEHGVCRLMLDLPDAWQPFLPWIEQLLEQSLAKGGKGIVVFAPQHLNTDAPGYQGANLVRVRMTATRTKEAGTVVLCQPSLAAPLLSDPQASLAAIAANCLGWQLTMALYAWFEAIPFSTEPAVERYKSITRKLRTQLDPLAGLQDASMLLLRRDQDDTSAQIVTQALCTAVARGDLHYLDVTLNGEPSPLLCQNVARHLAHLGNRLLGVPVKVRIAPAAYHISEQAQMDGPPLVSVRVLMRDHPAALLETYHATYLRAQAVATWQAMREVGRPCFLVLVDEASAPGGASDALDRFFTQVYQQVLLAFAEEKEAGHVDQS